MQPTVVVLMILRRPLHCCGRVIQLTLQLLGLLRVLLLQLRDGVACLHSVLGHHGLKLIDAAASPIELLTQVVALQRGLI